MEEGKIKRRHDYHEMIKEGPRVGRGLMKCFGVYFCFVKAIVYSKLDKNG